MVGGVGARVRSTLMAIKVVLCDDRDRRSLFFAVGVRGAGWLATVRPITEQITHPSCKLGPKKTESPAAVNCHTHL